MLGGARPDVPAQALPRPSAAHARLWRAPESEPPALVPASVSSSPGRAPPAAGCGQPAAGLQAPGVGPSQPPAMADRGCPLEAAPLPAEVLESLAELELELSEGESCGTLARDPAQGPRSSGVSPREPAGYPHAGSLPALPGHPLPREPCAAGPLAGYPASFCRVAGARPPKDTRRVCLGGGPRRTLPKGRLTARAVQGHGLCFPSLPCSLWAGRKPGMQKPSPTPRTPDCLVSLSFLIYKTEALRTLDLWLRG